MVLKHCGGGGGIPSAYLYSSWALSLIPREGSAMKGMNISGKYEWTNCTTGLHKCLMFDESHPNHLADTSDISLQGNLLNQYLFCTWDKVLWGSVRQRDLCRSVQQEHCKPLIAELSTRPCTTGGGTNHP